MLFLQFRPETLDSERLHRLPTFISALGNIGKQSNKTEGGTLLLLIIFQHFTLSAL